MPEPYRLAIVVSHPIQYFVPLYRYLAKESWVDLTVLYTSRKGVEPYLDEGFAREVKWDTDLLSGYNHDFLANWGSTGSGFLSSINPGVMARLKRSSFDAVLVHGHQFATYVLAIIAAKLRGVRVILRTETHLGLPRAALRRIFRTLVVAPLYRWCDVAAAIGTRNVEFYRHLGFRENRIVLAPYTVDNEFFRNAAAVARPQRSEWRRDHHIDPGASVVMYASKMTEVKRPLDLVQAFRILRGRGLNCALLFVGSGELESQVRSAVVDLPDVHFLGFLNQSELPGAFAMADVFVLPSGNQEPFGLIVNEAMAAGLPVVASDGVGAGPDLVIDGVTGYTYPVGDVVALADRLELAMDPPTLAALSSGATRRIAQWTIAHTAEGLREALARATERPRG